MRKSVEGKVVGYVDVRRGKVDIPYHEQVVEEDNAVNDNLDDVGIE
jgi:hypothetical protein